MEKKKLKLTISGSSKKTIDNIELAKSLLISQDIKVLKKCKFLFFYLDLMDKFVYS